MEEEVGRSRGGKARAASLTQSRRSDIAQAAAKARWAQHELQAAHGSADHPLRIGDIEIPCYVLKDGTRVITQGGFTDALGLARGGSMIAGMNRLELFVSRDRINPYLTSDLAARFANPISFVTTEGARALGFDAILLADLCEAVLRAREAGVLQRQQLGIAIRCELLVRGFARVGILALVDEATGYQKDRAKDALSKILEAFIAKELQPWVSTFSADFYEQMFRLRGLQFPRDSVQRPQYFGILTNDLVYKRLAPGVLDELKNVTEKTASGRPKHKYFQRLTNNVGYPKLREHLGAITAIMKLSRDWPDFMIKLNQICPRYGETYEMPLGDDGRGL